MGYIKVTSDHIPILIHDVVIDEPINIVSWNVLERDSCNGFSAKQRTTYGESPEQTHNRHRLIAAAIEKFVRSNRNPDFIALQEIDCTLPDGLFNQIMQRLNSESEAWGVTTTSEGLDLGAGCVILYRKNRYKQIIESPAHYSEVNLGGVQAKFSRVTHPATSFRIASAHARFSLSPHEHEAWIRNFCFRDDLAAIAVGDFNCPVLPADTTRSNITTSVAPPAYHRSETHPVQAPYAIDGGFFKAANGKEITQAPHHHLDARLFTDSAAPIVNSEAHDIGTAQAALPSTEAPNITDVLLEHPPVDLPEEHSSEQNEVARFRLGIAPHNPYRQQENKLQGLLNTSGLIARPSVNMNNERRIGISLTRTPLKELYLFLKKLESNWLFDIQHETEISRLICSEDASICKAIEQSADYATFEEHCFFVKKLESNWLFGIQHETEISRLIFSEDASVFTAIEQFAHYTTLRQKWNEKQVPEEILPAALSLTTFCAEPNKTFEEKVQEIRIFEKKYLPLLQDPKLKTVARYVASFVIAVAATLAIAACGIGVGVAIGSVAGSAAALSSLAGLLQGTVSGWALGTALAASVGGLAAGKLTHSFFNHKKEVQKEVQEEAEDYIQQIRTSIG